MRILRLIAVVAALSFIAGEWSPGVRAAGPVTEVLIGELLPLTGNFASLGQQYLWAGQTVEDIVNNDYPDLQVPLGPGKGFPGLGGAKMTLVVRDDQPRADCGTDDDTRHQERRAAGSDRILRLEAR